MTDGQTVAGAVEQVAAPKRPAVTRLTAKTLRKAHMCAMRYRRLGHPMPAGIALLDRDYMAWRRRVQRGRQPETLSAVPDA